MKVCELVGPTGVGKSAIYDAMLPHGGFVTNPKLTMEQAQVVFAEGIPEQVAPFCRLLEWIFETAQDHDGRLTKRISGTLRAFAKWVICNQPKAANDPRWLVIDGGLFHRGQGIDRLQPNMPVGRYFELAPLPDLIVLCSTDEETLRARNAERGGNHDRSDDIKRTLRADTLMRRILANREANVLELDTTGTLAEENAAKVLEAIGAKRSFSGKHAQVYEARRRQSPKWHWEQSIIENMLSDLKPGDWVLDCPVGTGRFLPFYIKHKLNFHAVDKSPDMLAKAMELVNWDGRLAWGGVGRIKMHGVNAQFSEADVCTLSMPRKWVDASVVCRLTRWLKPEECKTMMRNVQRITRKKIVFTTRVNHKTRAELARPLDLYPMDGWKIARIESMPSDEDYKIVMLEAA